MNAYLSDSCPGVLHLVDTLEPGGAERLAVDLANALPRERFRPFLGTTRREGALAAEVDPAVGRIALNRRTRLDLAALWHLRRFIRSERIQLVHAHASALFVGALVRRLCPGLRLLWHDHCGYADRHAPAWVYRLLTRGLAAEIVVKPSLRAFAVDELGLPPERVHVLPNFAPARGPATPADAPQGPVLPFALPVVCVANLRPQKDHGTLLHAFARVAGAHAESGLVLVGGGGDPAYAGGLRATAGALGLESRIAWLGQRRDVAALLRRCAVGVLSSRNEGFPIALLEYGAAGLATVATEVGACAEILDHGRAGLLVAPQRAELLAAALERLLADPALRSRLGSALRERVQTVYAPARVLAQFCEVYDAVLAR